MNQFNHGWHGWAWIDPSASVKSVVNGFPRWRLRVRKDRRIGHRKPELSHAETQSRKEGTPTISGLRS